MSARGAPRSRSPQAATGPGIPCVIAVPGPLSVSLEGSVSPQGVTARPVATPGGGEGVPGTGRGEAVSLSMFKRKPSTGAVSSRTQPITCHFQLTGVWGRWLARRGFLHGGFPGGHRQRLAALRAETPGGGNARRHPRDKPFAESQTDQGRQGCKPASKLQWFAFWFFFSSSFPFLVRRTEPCIPTRGCEARDQSPRGVSLVA